MATYQEK
jgi:hypothetical protein